LLPSEGDSDVCDGKPQREKQRSGKVVGYQVLLSNRNRQTMSTPITWIRTRGDNLTTIVSTLDVPNEEARFFVYEVGKNLDMRQYISAMLETMKSAKTSGALKSMPACQFMSNLEALLGMDIENMVDAWDASLVHRLRIPRDFKMPSVIYKTRVEGCVLGGGPPVSKQKLEESDSSSDDDIDDEDEETDEESDCTDEEGSDDEEDDD